MAPVSDPSRCGSCNQSHDCGLRSLDTECQAATAINLGAAESFVVLGGSTVTNTGPSVLFGDLGVYPGSSITGFPPGVVIAPGTNHGNDAVAQQAKEDLTAAYNVAAGQPSDFEITADLGGQTLVPGVYTAETSAGLTGELTSTPRVTPMPCESFRSDPRSQRLQTAQ